MAGNYYECPYCGEHLDWGEKHRCEPRTVRVVNNKLAKKAKKEEVPEIDYSKDPETIAARDACMAKIREMLKPQKN